VLRTGNPWLEKIARLGYQATGNEGDMGYIQRVRQLDRMYMSRVHKITSKLSEDEAKEVQRAGILGTPLSTPRLEAVRKELQALFSDVYSRMKASGVRIGSEPDEYWPLSWDAEKVSEKREDFIKMMQQPKYAAKLSSLRKTPAEIWETIAAYALRGEEFQNIRGKGEPSAASAHERTLGFLDRADRVAFMSDSLWNTAAQYVGEGVRQAAFTEKFGHGGEVLEQYLKKAEEFGATKEQMDQVQDYVDGLLGNKGVGMSRDLKDAYGAMSVYQNFRLLPFSLFSSLVDPLGIAVRSGSVKDAWTTFAYSAKNMLKGLKGEDYPRDFWEQYAEDWGIIEHAGMTSNVHNMFQDGIRLRGVTKDLNEKLFKYNLLNGWVRNNTIMAVAAAHRFMNRAANGELPAAHAERWLAELDLGVADLVVKDSKLLVTAADLEASGLSKDRAQELEAKLADATQKFVNQALLNPSSAELPNFMSNPYFAPITHLKKFVFAFQATVNDRIVHEAKNGNYTPAYIAAMYVPGMIAADFMRAMISNFGDEPPHKEGWGFADYVKEGVDRSGLTGVGAFFTAANEDATRGGVGVESALGPQIEQAIKGMRAATGQASMQNWAVEAMPLNDIFDQWLKETRGV
jgi:hypothetical protein